MHDPQRPFPEVKLSRRADRQIQKRLKQAYHARKRENKSSSWGFGLRLAYATFAFVLVVSGSGAGLAHHVVKNDSIIRGDLLYRMKRGLESYQIAQLSTSPERAEYYLKLSDRRLNEANEAFKRENNSVGFIPTAQAAPEITVDPDASLTAGLLSESSQFLNLSMHEAGLIEEVKVRTQLIVEIENTLEHHRLAITELTHDEHQEILAKDSSLDDVLQEAVQQSDEHQSLIDEFEDWIEDAYEELEWDDFEDWEDIEDWDEWWEDADDDEAFEDDFEWEWEEDDDEKEFEEELIDILEELEDYDDYEDVEDLEEEFLEIMEELEENDEFEEDLPTLEELCTEENQCGEDFYDEEWETWEEGFDPEFEEDFYDELEEDFDEE